MVKPIEPYSGPIVTRAAAKAVGQKMYFTGLPCKRGHIAQRRVISAGCSVCNAMQSAGWAAEHPDRMRELQAAWAAEHPDNLRMAHRRWRSDDTNREKERLYRMATAPEAAIRTAAWRAANPERDRENQRAWYAENRERALARYNRWKKDNPGKVRVLVQARRARLIGAEGSHTAAEVAELFTKQKGRCCHCFKPITLTVKQRNTMTEDHWVALSEGGTNWISNIKLSCKPCNSSKGAKDPFAFARKLGRLL